MDLFPVAVLGSRNYFVWQNWGVRASEYKFWSFCKPLIVFKVRSFKQKAVFRAPSKFPIW